VAVSAAVGTALGAVVGVSVGVDTAADAAVGPPNLPIPLAQHYQMSDAESLPPDQPDHFSPYDIAEQSARCACACPHPLVRQ
jgi:hypothetical protein